LIYFAQLPSGAVKIGYSANVDARLIALKSYYHQPLVLLGTIEGDREDEQALHKRFAHIRLHGTEQFRPTPELMEFIGKPLLVSANPESVEVTPPSKPMKRFSFYLYAEEEQILNDLRSELQARAPDLSVTMSDALRYALREYRRFKNSGQTFLECG
jgi:Meiotically up-regulated gene 113